MAENEKEAEATERLKAALAEDVSRLRWPNLRAAAAPSMSAVFHKEINDALFQVLAGYADLVPIRDLARSNILDDWDEANALLQPALRYVQAAASEDVSHPIYLGQDADEAESSLNLEVLVTDDSETLLAVEPILLEDLIFTYWGRNDSDCNRSAAALIAAAENSLNKAKAMYQARWGQPYEPDPPALDPVTPEDDR